MKKTDRVAVRRIEDIVAILIELGYDVFVNNTSEWGGDYTLTINDKYKIIIRSRSTTFRAEVGYHNSRDGSKSAVMRVPYYHKSWKNPDPKMARVATIDKAMRKIIAAIDHNIARSRKISGRTAIMNEALDYIKPLEDQPRVNSIRTVQSSYADATPQLIVEFNHWIRVTVTIDKEDPTKLRATSGKRSFSGCGYEIGGTKENIAQEIRKLEELSEHIDQVQKWIDELG